MTHEYDPVNDPADALYDQIRDKALQIKALTNQINALQQQLQTAQASRRTLIDELKALREGLFTEITGMEIK